MWHVRTRFSSNGGVGWMVGLRDLRGLFQPVILCGRTGRAESACEGVARRDRAAIP